MGSAAIEAVNIGGIVVERGGGRFPPDRSCRHGQRGPGRCLLSQLPRGTVCRQQDGARQDVEQFEQCRRNGLGGHS